MPLFYQETKKVINILNVKNISQEVHDWLTLALTSQVGPMTMNKLIAHFGSAGNVLNQEREILQQFLHKNLVSLILSRESVKQVDKIIEWLNLNDNHHILTPICVDYPNELQQLVDKPSVLFLRGDLTLLNNKKISVIGSRHPTTQGCINAFKFSQSLSELGITIVSGMAAGIDREAHLGGLSQKGSTIGVLGTGIDRIYPPSNKDLFNQFNDKGLLISEFSFDTPPLTQNFPRRNRIVAGLSSACLVVESAIDGGSMITANLALEMGREVMAIPGSIHNPVVRGCHKLIKQGAKLIENINDITEELNLGYKSNQMNEIKNLDPILEVIGFEDISIDMICKKLNKPFAEICARLLELELEGQIINSGSGSYQRIFR